MERQPLKAIIFDLDGTLYRMAWYFRPLFFLYLFPNGNRLPHYMALREAYSGYEMHDGVSLISALARELASKEKMTVHHTQQWIESDFYRAFVRTLPSLRNSRPGLTQTLSKLRSLGFRLAVVSDFNYIPQRLRALDIDESLFDHCISTEALGALKPHVRPFVELLDKWHIPPRQVLIVGDRDDTDGAAARKLGADFWLITDRAKGPGLKWPQIKKQLLALGPTTEGER